MTARVAAVALLAALVASACSDDGPHSAAPTTTTSTTMTSAPTSTSPPTTTTTTTGPSTTSSTTTTSTTTTTSLPPALDIEGSPMIEFSVAVGEGIDLTRDGLAAFVVETLGDERSWIGRGAGFRLVDEGGLFTLIVAPPDRVDEMCLPLQTIGIYSCARNGWVALNSDRWFGATDDWPGDLETYRHYLVNHEVGHYIVGPTHDSCPGPGQPAPIMQPQTKSLDGCEPNGWVDP